MATEKRLIDANALGRDSFHIMCEGEDGEAFERCVVDWDDIETAPTVDVVEVVHGYWCWEGKFKACSRCGSYVEWDETLGANFWKFCPYCGAMMDGGADNGL